MVLSGFNPFLVIAKGPYWVPPVEPNVCTNYAHSKLVFIFVIVKINEFYIYIPIIPEKITCQSCIFGIIFLDIFFDFEKIEKTGIKKIIPEHATFFYNI